LKGVEYLVKMLKAYGVNYGFGVPAIADLPYEDALQDEPQIKHITFHSEWTADAAAIGYATTSHKPAILDGESTHLATHVLRIHDAYAKSIPVIMLSFDKFSSPSRSFNEYTGNRGVDPKRLFAHITKWVFRCSDVELLPWCIRRAFAIATTGRPGPVLLEITTDVCKADINSEISVEEECHRVPAYRQPPSQERAREVAELLAVAKNPVIIAGGGVSLSQASEELLELAELIGAPVATTIMAKGQMPETHPLSIGIIGFGIPAFRRFITESSLVLLVGSRSGWEDLMVEPAGVPEKTQKIIHVDIDPDNIGRNYPNTIGMVSDAKLGLQAILNHLKTKLTKRSLNDFPVVAEIADIWRKHHQQLTEAEARAWDKVPISKLRLLREVREILPKDAVIQLAAGNLTLAQYQDVPFYPATTNMYKGMASGTISSGFAQIIGGALAAPDRPAVFFSGDGSLAYSLADLETLARYDLKNVVLIVANDSAWGSEVVSQLGLYNRIGDVRFLPVNYAKVAEEFNCRGIRVEEPSQLKDTLKVAFSREKPTLVDVVVADAADDVEFLKVYPGWHKTLQ
jgi:acetolactate synthase-1/2/3 large subunit